MRDYSQNKKIKASRKFRKKRAHIWNMMALVKSGARLFIATVSILGFMSLVYGLFFFFNTAPYFSLSSIAVAGNIKVSENDVIDASGLGEGTNIFSFSLSGVGRKVAEVPWVKEVSVKRVFPDSLSINVVEREPVALINVEGFYYIDEEGYVFAAAESKTGWNYPVLTGISREKLLDGDKKTFALLEDGVTVVDLLSRGGTHLSWDTVSEIRLDEDEGITIVALRGGTPIHLGRGAFENKLGRAEKVLSDLRNRGVAAARIEADFDERVIVRIAT